MLVALKLLIDLVSSLTAHTHTVRNSPNPTVFSTNLVTRSYVYVEVLEVQKEKAKRRD